MTTHVMSTPHIAFPSELVAGRLIQRRMRFLADVRLESDETLTAHVPNSGAMLGVKDPGTKVWLSESDNPNRKLKHTLEMVQIDGTLIGVNTSHPNAIVSAAIERQDIPELDHYHTLKREVKYGAENSRIDLVLERDDRPPCFVEVKNVHLSRDTGLAEFPDSVTTRGAKHMRELAAEAEAGNRAVVMFVVQRGDCDRFQVAKDIDPGYYEALTTAVKQGVEVLCYGCDMSRQGIRLGKPLIVTL